MKDRTKEIVKDGFGCLISNAAAIRGAKAGPLWLTILMFVLSVFLPVIPLFVNEAKTNGSSFLGSSAYGLERYITSMAMELENDRNVKFIINEDHLLSVTENGSDVALSSFRYTTTEETTPFAWYKDAVTNQYELLLYLSDAKVDSEKSLVNNAIVRTVYKTGETNKAGEEDTDYYHPNYIILFENGVYFCLYGQNSIKALTYSYSGDFKTIEPNNDCLKTLLTVTNKKGEEVAQSIINDDYTSGVYNNFKKFLDKSYETLKVKNMWIRSLIYLGIFFGVSILMGFIMWIITRGKNNPNNYYTPWLTLKIQGRLGLAPALITLIIGFLLIKYAPVAFISMLGLRVVWISMKELKPVQ